MRRYESHKVPISFTICISTAIIKIYIFYIVKPLLIGIGCTSWDSNTRHYDYESDAIPLSYRLICDMNEHLHNMYEYIMTKPFTKKNQGLSDKIWFSTVRTIYEKIISSIF